MNQFVPQAVHDNEATWGKLVDELIMLSGSGNISSGSYIFESLLHLK